MMMLPSEKLQVPQADFIDFAPRPLVAFAFACPFLFLSLVPDSQESFNGQLCPEARPARRD